MEFHDIFNLIIEILGFSALCTICGGILDSFGIKFFSFLAKLLLVAGSFTTILVLLYFYNTYQHAYNEKRNLLLIERSTNQEQYDILKTEIASLESDISASKDLVDKKLSRIDALRRQNSDLIDQIESL